MKERGVEVKVGALVLFSLALLAGFVWLLGDFGVDDSELVVVEFADIGGLKPGAEVKLGGMEIGKVREIEFVNGEASEVDGAPIWARVSLDIEAERFDALRVTSRFSISSESVLGEKFVAIATPNPKDESISAGHVFRGQDPVRIDELMLRFDRTLSKVDGLLGGEDLKVDELVAHLDALVLNADGLLVDNRERIDSLLIKADHLMGVASDIAEDSREPIQKLWPRLDNLLTKADALLADAKLSLSRISSLSAKLESELPPVLASVGTAAENIEALSQQARTIADDAAPKLSALLDEAALLLDDLRATSAVAKALAEDVNKGRGTVGLLLKDEELFDDLRELVRELKRRPWRMVWKE